MTRPLRVGLVGLGRIFDLNVLGYIGHPDVRIVGLCDSREEVVAERGRRFPEARTTTRYDELLGWDLDLVDILTPHPLHEAMSVAALEAGAHVSVQKPMAMDVAECDRMIEAAQHAGRRLKLFENFVFYEPLVKAKALIEAGAIGRPSHCRMKVVFGRRDAGWHVPAETQAWRYELGEAGRGGPIIFDHGHHLMATALWLFGEVRDGFAFMETTRVPDGPELDAPASLVWRHRHPPVHTVWEVSLALEMHIRTDYYPSHERFEIQGESGIIEVRRCSDRLLDEPAVTLYRDGEVRAFHNLEDDWGESFRRSTLHHIDVLMGRAPELILTPEEGRRVVELFHLLDSSARSGRPFARPEPGSPA